MFETVAPESFRKKSRRALYESLPLSIAIHLLAIGSVFMLTLWNVSFPGQSPRVMRPYSLVTVPDPPPPPPPPAPPKAVVQLEQPPVIQMAEVVAPAVIPDIIPIVRNELPRVEAQRETTGGVEGGIASGLAGGSLQGVQGGDGGTIGGTIGGISPKPVETIVHIARDKVLPMHPMSQVYPAYPERERQDNHEDSVVVRYRIGKDGRVKEVVVISHAERRIFDEAAVNAIRHWRFRPLIKDGEAREVDHELTVNFRLQQGS